MTEFIVLSSHSLLFQLEKWDFKVADIVTTRNKVSSTLMQICTYGHDVLQICEKRGLLM